MKRPEKSILHWDGVVGMALCIHKLDLGGGFSSAIRISRLFIILLRFPTDGNPAT